MNPTGRASGTYTFDSVEIDFGDGPQRFIPDELIPLGLLDRLLALASDFLDAAFDWLEEKAAELAAWREWCRK